MHSSQPRRAIAPLMLAMGFATAIVLSSADVDAEKLGKVRANEVARANGGATGNALLLANQILDRWQPVAEQAGVSFAAWREMLITQMGLMEPSMLEVLDAVKIDETGSAKRSYARFAQAFRDTEMTAYVLATAGKGRLKLGSTTGDQVFIPITPCRIVDTRNVGGPIVAGTTRAFYFYTAQNPQSSWADQGGAPGASVTSCPGTVLTPIGGTLGSQAPSAAIATVTAVNPSAAGNLVVWGGAGSVPESSALNFAAGQTLANTTVVPWGGRVSGSVLDFAVSYNGPSGQADVVVDVVGFMVENTATALECVTLTVSSPCVPNAVCSTVPASCGTGYTRTGSNCVGDINGGTILLDDETHCVMATGGGTNPYSFLARTRCCRIPGQ